MNRMPANLPACRLVLTSTDSEEREPSDLRDAERADAAFDVVLLAEGFDAAGGEWQRQLVEMGELAAPALARAAELDRFPTRTGARMVRSTGRSNGRGNERRAARIGGRLASVAALAFIPATLTVEAPATLRAAVRRDIFATATGAVAEVRVGQGDQVKQGDVLIVLADPELSLKLQQVRGEIDATRERLAAMAVTRTDRTLRERGATIASPCRPSNGNWKNSSRISTLNASCWTLATRRSRSAVRSTGRSSRPTCKVCSPRGRSSAGNRCSASPTRRAAGNWWPTCRSETSAPSSRRSASSMNRRPSAASYRLSGDVEPPTAHLLAVNAAAPLETEGLEDETPPMKCGWRSTASPPRRLAPGWRRR